MEKILKITIFLCIVGFGTYFTYPFELGYKDHIAYLHSFWITISLTIISIFIGLILGTILSILRLFNIRILNFVIDEYIDILRGTPMILQLLIFAFIILASFRDNYYAAVIALGLNSSAYIAEIIRSGINSVDKGQMEASRALGLSFLTSLREIIFPQAIKNILPALVNEFITLFKETSIVGYVAIVDLTMKSYSFQSVLYNPKPIIFAGVVYYACVRIFSVLAKLLEKKLKKD